VSAAGVVGFQDLANEDKEVQYATLGKGHLDGRCSLALAQYLIPNVGMRHVAVPFGSVLLLCDDLISAGLADAFPVEDDPERAQLHVFQHDRSR